MSRPNVSACTVACVIALLSACATAQTQNPLKCPKNYQPYGERCVTQRMADYISCIEASGANHQEITEEVNEAAGKQASGEAKGSGSGLVAKGSGSIVVNAHSEKELVKRFQQKWYSDAMKQCANVLQTSQKKSSLEPTAPAKPQPDISQISQNCPPGASCAISNGQRGGVTAGTYNNYGPKPRITRDDIPKLAAQFAGCHSGSTTASPNVVNPTGTTEQDAANVASAFAQTHTWSYSGVSHTIKGQDVGPDGPIPDPTGIHIYSDTEHKTLAQCVQRAFATIGVTALLENKENSGDSVEILVGNSTQ